MSHFSSESESVSPFLPNKTLPFSWYFVRRSWWVFMLMAVLEVGFSSFTMLVSYGVKELMEGVENAQGQEDILTAIMPALWFFVWINVGAMVCDRLNGGLMAFISPRKGAEIRENLFVYLQQHSQKYFINNFAGSLSSRVREVSEGAMSLVWTVLFEIWPVLITFGASFFLLYGVSAHLASVFIVWVVVYLMASFMLSLRAGEMAKTYAAARSEVGGKVVDALTNMAVVKMFARHTHERKHMKQTLEEEVRQARRILGYMEVMWLFQAVFSFILLIGMTFLALEELIAGQLSQGEFAMVFSLMLLIINHISNLSRVFMNLFEVSGTVAEGLGVIVCPHEVTNKPGAQQLEVSKGEIALENVSFYHDESQHDEGQQEPLFADLNLNISPGQKVGLVGVSGAGKSTLVNLLLRLYDVNSGQIKIDGQNISDVTQESLREQIAMIPQEPMLFHRSLMENIRYGQLDATDEDVIAASKKAFCHEFIMETEQGYNTLVGERGVKLSGGQRQRIAIARALLKNAPILLLDEATSSLDTHSEKYIQKSLNQLMENRTVVVVAHRLSTIAHLDRIVVLQNGEVVEDDKPATLMADKNSYFGTLWAMQADGFFPEV